MGACVVRETPTSPIPGAFVRIEFAAPTGIRGPSGGFRLVDAVDGRVLHVSSFDLVVRITTAESTAGGPDPALAGRTVSVNRSVDHTVTVVSGPDTTAPSWIVVAAPMLVFLVGVLGPT